MPPRMESKQAQRQVSFKATEIPKGLNGSISHVSSHAPNPREQQIHMHHSCFRSESQTWNTCITSRSPRTPQGGLDGQNPTSHTNTIREVGNTGTATTQLKRDVYLKQDCMPTVRCKSTEPASKINPSTTHTPSRTVDPNTTKRSTPRNAKASEQMEASSSAMSTSLGVTTTRNVPTACTDRN